MSDGTQNKLVRDGDMESYDDPRREETGQDPPVDELARARGLDPADDPPAAALEVGEP
jgi:hypothetical protein